MVEKEREKELFARGPSLPQWRNRCSRPLPSALPRLNVLVRTTDRRPPRVLHWQPIFIFFVLRVHKYRAGGGRYRSDIEWRGLKFRVSQSVADRLKRKKCLLENRKMTIECIYRYTSTDKERYLGS